MGSNRYLRHLMLDGFSEKTQQRLSSSQVLIVGCGGLGSPAALYLAAAGVGHLGIMDSDVVELSNLQRQILHSTETLSQPKVQSARATLLRLNPDIRITPYHQRLTPETAEAYISKYDLVIDATDNYNTKFLLNDVCIKRRIPLIYGGIVGYEGQAMTIIPDKTPCLRCLFNGPPPESVELFDKNLGTFGPLCGIIGSIQAAEALNLLGRLSLPDKGCLISVNSISSEYHRRTLSRNPNCTVCSH